MTTQEIEQRAEQILQETGSYGAPVPIEILAQRLNLTTQAAKLQDKISGLLVVENGRGAIGYNKDHAPVRQRFTVAHEIAHYVLHVNKKRSGSQLFVDRYVAFRRDDSSALGSDSKEVDANRFGAALLMPAKLVREEIRRHDLNLDDEHDLALLAKKFQVSSLAMTNRLTSLGLLR